MPAPASWAIELIDRVTAPGARIDRMLSRLESRITSTTSATRGLVGGFNSAASAGENSARRITAAWRGVRSGIDGSRAAMQGMVTQLTVAAAAAAGVGYAGKSILDAAAQRESNLSQIGFLLKTSDSGRIKGASNWINRFADITPFTDHQTIKTVRQAMSYGFSWDQMKGLTMVTGDAASIVGDNPEDAAYRWTMIMRAMGQIKSKGRLQQEELNQLQEHGIGANAYLDAAFGPNRAKLQAAGKISGQAAIRALIEGMSKDFGGGMLKQSQTLFGLASTLKSRPQRVFGTLAENGGLDDLKRLFRNLIELTDFGKDPGRKLLQKLSESGARLTKAIFGPLADSTQGAAAERNIDHLVEQLDKVSAWWTIHGPRIGREVRGFGEGLKGAGEMAESAAKPLIWLGTAFDKLSGGNGEGVLGKMLGFTAGSVVLGRILNFLSFGMLSKLGAKAGQAILGGVAKAWAGSAWERMMFMRSVRGAGWLRALGLDGLGTRIASVLGSGGVAGTVARFLGWVGVAITSLDTIGQGLYGTWDAFTGVIDKAMRLLERLQPLLMRLSPQLGLGQVFGGGLLQGRGIAGAAQNAWSWVTGQGGGDSNFAGGVNAMARRLGINPEDLLKVMNFESGLNPAARNKKSGATGLIQFLSGTAAELGTSTDALSRMSATEQLPYVEAYLRSHGVQSGMGLEQLYMSVLRGNPKTGALWSRGSTEYSQNAGLDADQNGVITSAEAVAKVQAAWTRDLPRIQQTLAITVAGSVDPAAVQAIQQAGYQGALNALGTIGAEGGY